jgi:GGDEF domain-containing protein
VLKEKGEKNMCQDNVLAPEIGLIKSDEFYLFYEMMIQSLKTDDVKEGLNKSLFLLKSFLKSGNIALYRKNEDGIYVFKLADSKMGELVQPVSCIINKTHPLIEQNEIFNIDLNFSERLNNMMFFHIKIDNNDDCIISIINADKNKDLEPQFWQRTKDTMQVILKRAASYERNTKAVTTDLLTGLDNRNSYEMRIQSLNEADDDLVMGIFDLFRLKHINDNYTHAKGDKYIKKTADILNKYWPKLKTKLNDDGTESFEETGHCVYRIGGDEFVLFTKKENLQLAGIKANLAKEEASLINLNVGENIPLGFNFGLVKHNPGDSIKQTFMRADELMQQDKDAMYKRLRLDRRRN